MTIERAVVLTLAGPLQSWGSVPGAANRPSERFPTKSAVIGLADSALGYCTEIGLSTLSGLRFAVRADFFGDMLTDFHTVSTVNDRALRKGQWIRMSGPLSSREYRADAVYTAALSSTDHDLIETIHQALLHPVHAPFLGRKSAVPSRPVYPASRTIHNGTAIEALSSYAWDAPAHVLRRNKESLKRLYVLRDAQPEDVVDGYLSDTPAADRTFLPRAIVRDEVTVKVPDTHRVSRGYSAVGNPMLMRERSAPVPSAPAHDPFSLLDPKV